MREFLSSLQDGVLRQELAKNELEILDKLISLKAIKNRKDLYYLDDQFRIGKLDISQNGTGYLQTYNQKNFKKDLLIEPKDLNSGARGDIVVAKRIFKRNERAKAKVVFVLKRQSFYSVVCLKKTKHGAFGVNIKTLLNVNITASKKSLLALPDETILKIDNENGTVVEVLGVLSDDRVDEKISLALFEKNDEFSRECENEALSYGTVVDKDLHDDYVDLTHLPFCTIDPVDAKDFDDAIYFDEKNCTLFVAIADVSTYVSSFSHIDNEAKKRGFSIYFPHKSVPMLPRNLSENICSLKPNEDRLSFCFKITLDPQNLEVKSEELLNAVINSKRRFNYDEIDLFLQNKYKNESENDKLVFTWLKPLNELIRKIRAKRLQNGYEFRSDEIKMQLDNELKLQAVFSEEQTPSHELIEDCMLLANKAAAKRVDYGVFRNHEEPSFGKIEELLIDLEMIGLDFEFNANLPKLIKDIQKRADEINLREDVDKLIIKSQKKAMYGSENRGHFGLGFDKYTHFTSPIRRYSDLILHRILKCQLNGDEKYLKYQLNGIDELCESVSMLERQSDLVARDFMDRKFARWAGENINKEFDAIITDVQNKTIAKLNGKIKGARIFLLDSDVDLLQKVKVKILDVNLLQAVIIGKITKRLD